MKPSHHLAGSIAVAGALYAATGSPPAALSCLASGVLIDLDHLVDFFGQAGANFTPRSFVEWCYSGRATRFFLPLHSYELFAALAFWASRGTDPAAAGVVAGVGVHLAMDQYGNRQVFPGFRTSRGFYFLLWRALLGFRKARLLRPSGPAASAGRALPSGSERSGPIPFRRH